MAFISIIIAAAGMSLGLAGPEAGHVCEADCTKACCVEPNEEAHACAMCEKMEDGKMCAMCEAHADMGSKVNKTDHAKMGHEGHEGHGKAHKAMHKIDSALYGNAAWPTHNTGESLYAKNFQGQALPVALGNETWISKKTNLEGKVVVLDFWATWCPPCRAALPILDQLQKDNKENLAVVAIGGQREDEATVRSFVAEHKESINNLFDADQSVYSKFESRGIPLVVVMSTDGIIRWIGNPHDENFQKAVDQVLAVDPMIAAKG